MDKNANREKSDREAKGSKGGGGKTPTNQPIPEELRDKEAEKAPPGTEEFGKTHPNR